MVVVTVTLMSAAFFDVDGTLLSGSFAVTVGRKISHLMPASRLRASAFAAYNVRFRFTGSEYQVSALAGSAAAALQGVSVEECVAYTRMFTFSALGSRLFEGSWELLSNERRKGRQVVLATAAPQFVADAVAEFVGADVALGTVLGVRHGLFDGTMPQGLCHGSEKLARVRAHALECGFSLGKCSAYSDSVHDLPLLTAVGFPTVVNPDRVLAKCAGQLDWPVLRTSPRAGDVVRTAAGVSAASLAAAVVAGAAGAAAFRSKSPSCACGC